MDINSIISTIPNVLAGLYEAIFVIGDDSYYQVIYDGDELIVSVPYDLNELSTIFTNYKEDMLSIIKSSDSIKRVFKTKDGLDKLVVLTTIDMMKMVFITDTTFTGNSSTSSSKLLIADDSSIICNFFKKSLGDDFDILVAGDGNEAIELLEQYKNDNLLAAFIDLNMPNKNGYEVLEYMRNNNMMELVPASVISGEDSKESIDKVIELGVVDMLQKPFTADAARAIVNKTIQTHKK